MPKDDASNDIQADNATDDETRRANKITYAEDIPSLLRDINLRDDEIKLGEKLEKLPHLERIARGAIEWNVWVQWAELTHGRWLSSVEKDGATKVRLKSEKDSDFHSTKIDFSDSRHIGKHRNYPERIIDFSDFCFPSQVSFEKVTFYRPTRFTNANFLGDVDFEGATFQELANFTGANFLGDAFFTNAKFESKARFGNVNFSGIASFHSADIEKVAVFQSASFGDNAYFKGTRFKGGADFMDTHWLGESNLDEAVFEDSAFFHKAIFTGKYSFREIRFSGQADFRGAEFEGLGSFRHASFDRRAFFGGSAFKRITNFTGSFFKGEAHFRHATFNGKVNFEQACFFGIARFDSAQFRSALGCRQTVFFTKSYWGDAQINGSAEFQMAQFLNASEFANTRFGEAVNFDHVWFGKTPETSKPPQFNSWDSDIKARYLELNVNNDSQAVPDFKSARFEIAPNLGFTNVPPPFLNDLTWYMLLLPKHALSSFTQITNDTNAAAKYRRLAELAAQGHHHHAEKRFFRGELLCRRGHETNGWREVTMINLFETFSMCGLSFWRPIGWLTLMALLCGVFYFAQMNWSLSEMHSISWFELSSFTFLNSLPLVGYISDSYSIAAEYLFGGIDSIPRKVRVVAVLQNVISAIFIFFALLAVRNYFKLG